MRSAGRRSSENSSKDDQSNESTQRRQSAYGGPAEQATAEGEFEDTAMRFRLQEKFGNQGVRHLVRSNDVQPRLKVSDPHDRSEREAERVARTVTGPKQFLTDTSLAGSGDIEIRRMCTPCRSRLLDGEPLDCPECEHIVQRHARGDADEMRQPSEFKTGLRGARGTGRRLPTRLQEDLESKFGHDFEDVRIHDGADAARLNEEIHAEAFTHGRDIYFSEGAYRPQTKAGRQLLAHELTHVVQQRAVPASSANPVQRQFLPLDLGRNVIGRVWLGLSDTRKAQFADQGLRLAITALERFPGQSLLGAVWPLFREGMLGFLSRVRDRGEETKIAAIDAIARIVANESLDYAIGLATGIVKGFFIDGLLGIFLLIRDLIRGISNIGRFIDWVGDLVGQFPDAIQRMADELKAMGWTLYTNIEPAIDEAKSLFLDPGRVFEFASFVAEQSMELASAAGERIADALLDFFSQPDAERATGVTMGRVLGFVLFEVVFAVLTAGSGLILTSLKAAGRMFARLAARITGSILASFRAIVAHIDVLTSSMRGMGEFLGSGVLRTVFDYFQNFLQRLRGFSQQILRHCHESRLTCEFPWGDAPRPVPTGTSLGARQAREQGWPATPDGYHWVGREGGTPYVRRDPNHDGPPMSFDRQAGEFVRGSRGRPNTRPPLDQGRRLAPLPDRRFRRWSESLRGSAQQEQQRIMNLARSEPSQAGLEYQGLIARDLYAVDAQELMSRPGRRPDIGVHEVTIQGRNGRFGSEKLNQFWFDLVDRREILLTVPRLSDKAAEQLRIIGAQAEQELGETVMVFVRETM